MGRISVSLGAALMCSAFAACGGGGAGGGSPNVISTTTPAPRPTHTAPAPTQPNASTPIQHIVVIVQENRSFDNLFSGFPGADTVSSGKMSDGTTVALQPIPLEQQPDIDHSHSNFLLQYSGGRLFFDRGTPKGAPPSYPYAYVPRAEIVPYWTLAQQWTLADRMFQSNSGPSFPAHLFLVSAQSGENNNVADNPTKFPWGCDSPTGTQVNLLLDDGTLVPTTNTCYDYSTLADRLDQKNLTWKYYAPSFGGLESGYEWSAFDAIQHIRFGPHWSSEIVSPETNVLKDIAAGNLPSVAWVTPSLANSDHVGGSNTGPEWVASVVNAIGTSALWKNTAILITWDDWGGWYDHVAPPQIDKMGLGFRVPLIAVSPYAKQSHVSHVPYEFGSILKFIERNWGLAPLGASDSRANNLADCFDFTQAPAAFRPIATKRRASYFLEQAPSLRPPDD